MTRGALGDFSFVTLLLVTLRIALWGPLEALWLPADPLVQTLPWEHTAPAPRARDLLALRQVPGESGRLLTLKRLIGGRYVKWNFKWRGLYFKSASLPVYAMRCPLEWTGWTVPAGVLAAPAVDCSR